VSVRVLMFAVARQLAGLETIVLELPPGSTVGQLRERLAAEVPALAPVLPQMLFAVGSRYVKDDATLRDDAEVACIPPVSGG
jgi:sulfur-carrier protein